jgi:hypothetical protein
MLNTLEIPTHIWMRSPINPGNSKGIICHSDDVFYMERSLGLDVVCIRKYCKPLIFLANVNSNIPTEIEFSIYHTQ